MTISASPRQRTSPDPSHSLPKSLEAGEVSNDPVIPVMTSQLLRELLVLFPDREVQIFSAPFRQCLKRSLESAFRRCPLDHPFAPPGSSPVVSKSQKVECRWFGWIPFLGRGVVRPGRLKPHHACLLRMDRQTVLAHPLG